MVTKCVSFQKIQVYKVHLIYLLAWFSIILFETCDM